MAEIRREKITIPTYPAAAPEKAPMFFEMRNNQNTRGNIYPLPMIDRVTDDLIDKEYDAIRLENEFLRCTVLPELGGRIYEGYDKATDFNFVYLNEVIKPALIGVCGTWISGGIEFNWPQHHRPTTFMPVDCVIEENEDGSKTAWVGEIEPLFGTKGMVGVTIYPEKSYIQAKVKLYNSTPNTQTFHWWSNLAVNTCDDYQLLFPPDIDYVTFHYKNVVADYPMVKGLFNNIDFGDGVDVSYPKNVPAPGSFFIFNSNYSFMGGYDHGKSQGTVHIADRHISPGKKFFTWGEDEFGQVWQGNLTDENGPYIEIMTGVYTDNQPDFAWLAPYETKTFEQYWYALSDVPNLKNANIEGAVSFVIEDGVAKIAFNSTSKRENATAVLKCGEKVLFEQKLDIAPGNPFVADVSISGDHSENDMFVALYDDSGSKVVSYQKAPMYFDDKIPPQAHEPSLKPEEIETIEQLYLEGLQIEQFRHPTLEPDPYYLEALKRDPGDCRSNNAMGMRSWKRADFGKACEYFQRSIDRLISRNPNPYDSESYYNLGITLKHLGKDEDAINALKKAMWSYAWRSAALYECAVIFSRQGRINEALNEVEKALTTNQWSLKTRGLYSALLRLSGNKSKAKEIAEETIKYDPLDYTALYENYKLTDKDQSSAAKEAFLNAIGSKVFSFTQLAADYIDAGFYDNAREILQMCEAKSPLIHWYNGYISILNRDNDSALAEFKLAEECDMSYCYPNTLMDFRVLECAVKLYPSGAWHNYHLGTMYYSRRNTEPAICHWECALKNNDNIAYAHRGLSFALYEKLNDSIGALYHMKRAFELEGTARILFELVQAHKIARTAPDLRLDLLEQNFNLVDTRDDLYLEYIALLNQTKHEAKAVKMLQKHIFHPYEGGEGILPKQHILAHLRVGYEQYIAGRFDEALEMYNQALVYTENYHEGRKYRAREGHAFYHIATAHIALGNIDEARKWLEKCADEIADCDEAEFFKGISLRVLGRSLEATEVFRNMINKAEKKLESETGYEYFEVFPIGQPFEQDMVKLAKIKYYSCALYGYAGLGNQSMAQKMHSELSKYTDNLSWADIIINSDYTTILPIA